MTLNPYFDRPRDIMIPRSGLIPSWGDVGTNLGTDWGLTNYPLGVSGTLSRLRNEAIQPLTGLMSADLIETDSDFQVHVDMPGAENLDISVDNGVLSISAERKVSHERDTDIAHTVERSYGRVQRRVALPSNADGDRATAKYQNGVLTVTMPKKEPSKRARLRIE